MCALGSHQRLALLCAVRSPVAPLIKFEEEAEAVAMANDTTSGLAAYFYSRDIGRAFRVSEALQFGMVGVNEGPRSAAAAAARRRRAAAARSQRLRVRAALGKPPRGRPLPRGAALRQSCARPRPRLAVPALPPALPSAPCSAVPCAVPCAAQG